MSTTVRPPAVAGTFYTGDATSLAATVDRYVADALAHAHPAAPPKALVVPHAGYVFSGEVAGRGYALVTGAAEHIERVVLLGPAHRLPVRSMAVPAVDAFRTPLGDVPIDVELRAASLALPFVEVDDRPHGAEHSLEVHLPFLQRILRHPWTVLPVVVGGASPEEVASLLATVWGGPETLVVVSTDLSHYEPYAAAARHDDATADRIVHAEWETIGTHDACGAHPLRGLLALARTQRLRIEQVDLRSSGDTAGDRDRVVGYGAFALYEEQHG
jgi:AmmeMemoRadiSam system protein B